MVINLTEKNISQVLRLKIIIETKNDFTEDTEQDKLMSKKYKKVYAILNYNEH